MWIILALSSRFLWSGCNALDQVLSRAHRTRPTEAVLGLLLCIDLPLGLMVLAFAGRGGMDATALCWTALAVAAQIGALVPYFIGMQREDAHNIVPYLEMTPVFVTALAWRFLGDAMSVTQAAGAAMVIGCGFLFSWDFSQGRFKRGIFLLMVLCSLCFALGQFFLHLAQQNASTWSVTGVFLLGTSAVGFVFLGMRPATRRSITETIRETRGRTVLLGFFSNLFTLSGIVCLLMAFAAAPTAGHASGLSGVQPFFSFFLAAALARFFPAHFTRVSFDRETKAKLFLILGIVAGVWLLARG